MPQEPKRDKLDFRLYIGMILFRWQIIVVCFLYSLLGGVLYLQVAPKQFLTHCKLMIYRDPKLDLGRDYSPWKSFNAHTYLLQNEAMRKKIVDQLMRDWGERVGSAGRMLLWVDVTPSRQISSTMEISIKSRYPLYAQEFLKALISQHKVEWDSIQKANSRSASDMLTSELGSLEEKIRKAEDDLIEYLRINDLYRADAKSTMEARYLSALMERRSMLMTEIMLIEAEYPFLKNANAEVISHVSSLTRDTGAVRPIPEELELGEAGKGRVSVPVAIGLGPLAGGTGEKKPDESSDTLRGWQDLRVKLEQAKLEQKELSKNLKPEHPQYKAVQEKIAFLEKQLDLASRVEMQNLKDRHEALMIQLKALESAEYKWKADNLLASKRRAELARISDVVGRFQGNYDTLYGQLHNMRISEELKAEYFSEVEPVTSDPDPVWPDPLKIMMVALALGLGSGFGLALLAQTFDNKIQTISDVESDLGVRFLGGVPYWVHSGLEKSIRPIVTEEHSTGAIEAYRALRTTLIRELEALNERTIIITSADSREGKTLTALNIAIMFSQMNRKVLLMDMDLRRGRLHRSLGIEREPGLTDVLAGRATLSDAIRATRFENLWLAPAGSTMDNTAELLQSSDVPGMLTDAQSDYDIVIVDSSPVLRVTDASIIVAQGVGVVVYVARVNHKPKPMIKYSLDLLRGAKVLGLIMNSIEMHKISSLYYAYQYPNYAYYSNAYAYGYDYYYYGDKPGDSGGAYKRRHGLFEKRWRDFMEWVRNLFLPME